MNLKQSRLGSLVDSIGNTASGFVLGLAGQAIFLIWWKGLPMTWQDNVEFALFMTVVSVARGYGWRRLTERYFLRARLSPSLQAVAAERLRQEMVEGYSAERDDAYPPGELATAAAAYLLTSRSKDVGGAEVDPADVFPWADEHWKPADVKRNLIKGGALCLAELDRLERMRRRKGRKS